MHVYTMWTRFGKPCLNVQLLDPCIWTVTEDLPRIIITRASSSIHFCVSIIMVIILLTKLQLAGQNIKMICSKALEYYYYVIQEIIFSVESEEHQPLII